MFDKTLFQVVATNASQVKGTETKNMVECAAHDMIVPRLFATRFLCFCCLRFSLVADSHIHSVRAFVLCWCLMPPGGSNSLRSMSGSEPTEARYFTREEIRRHASAEDCWVIVRGLVYALPPDFVYHSHPGGPYIMGCAGTDATTTFEDGPHTGVSREVLAEFLIGALAPDD